MIDPTFLPYLRVDCLFCDWSKERQAESPILIANAATIRRLRFDLEEHLASQVEEMISP